MMNGTGDTLSSLESSSKTKPWDHVWSIEEMRKEAPNWRLASDAGLLLHLQDFSHRMLTRTHEIQEQIDAVVHEAKLTGVRVNNVLNDFITLANTQFVENRVYDEDVSGTVEKEVDKKIETKERSNDERETELISRIKEAVGLGINILDSDYDRLDLNVANSDSEDETSITKFANVLYESKDPYIHRQLPHLIGSEAFEENDDVGLNFVLPDEDEVQSQRRSPEPQPTVQSGHVVPPAGDHSSRAQLHSSSSEESEDLFKEPLISRAQQSAHHSTDNLTNPPDFNSQLSAQLNSRNNVPSGGSSSHAEDVKQDESVKKMKQKSEDLFAFPIDDEDQDEGDIFRRSTGLFSAPSQRSRLFDDEVVAERGGLFDSVPGQSTKPQPSAKVNHDEPKTIPPLQTETVAPKGLFDEDDEDLFSVPSAMPVKSAPTVAAPSSATGAKTLTVSGEARRGSKPVVDLFGAEDDDDDEDFFKPKAALHSTTKQKVPAGAVSVFSVGGDEQFKAAVARSRTIDSEQVVVNDNDKFRPSATVKSSLLQGEPGMNSTQSSSSLFADDPELFVSTSASIKSSGTSTTGVSQAASSSRKKINLFDDEEEDDGDLFSTMIKALPTKNLKPAPQDKASKLVVQDDLFAAVQKVETSSSQTIKPAVQQSSASVKSSTEVSAGKSMPAKKVMSLFDENDSDEEQDDLFGTAVKPNRTAAKAVTQSAKSISGNLPLFGDDILFTSPDENPGVDLFGSNPSSPSATPNKSSELTLKQTSSQPPVNKSKALMKNNNTDDITDAPRNNENQKPVAAVARLKTAAATDIFADVEDSDDEDLFSPSKPFKNISSKLSATVEKNLFAPSEPSKNTSTKSSVNVEKDLFAPSEPSKNTLNKSSTTVEKNLFAPSEPSKNTSTKSSVNVENDLFAEKDLFAPSEPSKNTLSKSSTTVEKNLFAPSEPSKNTSTKSSVNVEKDLFAPSEPSKNTLNKSSTTVEKNLFAPSEPSKNTSTKSSVNVENDLFAEKDLFAPSEPSKNTLSKSSTTVEKNLFAPSEPSKNTSTKSSVNVENDLFAEKDLFAPSEPSKITSTKSSATVEKDIFAPRKPSDAEAINTQDVLPSSKALDTFNKDDLFVPSAESKKPNGDAKQVEDKPLSAVTSKLFSDNNTKDFESESADVFQTKEEHSNTSKPESGRQAGRDRIALLQSNLAINPTALLPSSKRPKQNPVETVVPSFDEQPETQTLQNMAKDRVRIQVKRKPPTRKTQSYEDASNFVDDLTENSTADAGSSISRQNHSILSVMTVEDSTTITPLTNSTLTTSSVLTRSQHPPSEPLLVKETAVPVDKDPVAAVAKESVASVAKESVAVMNKNTPVLSDDIFDFPVTMGVGKQRSDVKLFDDEIEDLFANSILTKTATTVKSSKSNVPDSVEDFSAEVSSATGIGGMPDSKPRIIADKNTLSVEEDIFANSVLQTGTTRVASIQEKDLFKFKSSKAKAPFSSVFDDDDDDIFAVKTKPSSSKPAAGAAPKRVIDDDDLFGTSSKSMPRRVVTTRDDKLFAEDSDIFADILPKSKAVVNTKTLPKVDDNEDIFAEVAATKPTSSSTKSSKVIMTNKTDDIFDDPLNAFNL